MSCHGIPFVGTEKARMILFKDLNTNKSYMRKNREYRPLSLVTCKIKLATV